MLIRLTPPPTLAERQMQLVPKSAGLGCADCALIASMAGLGCVPQCSACPNKNGGLGALDFSSAGIGAGTMAALAIGGLVLYALMGSPAKERRRKLAAAKKKYDEEVARIKSSYGRLGRRGD